MTILWPSTEPCALESAASLVASTEWDSIIALWPHCGCGAVFWHVHVHDLGQQEMKDLSASVASDAAMWV